MNATLSYASAVPLIGWASAGTKLGIKVVNVANDINTHAKLTWKILDNGLVHFGSSGSKLRKVLGITDSALQAHHLIPWSIRNHDVIQKAAKSGSAFHINEALNGLAVASWRNQPNHNVYNSIVNNKLDDFVNTFPNANPDQCYTFVSNLVSDIRDWVISNPNSHLNDLILP